MPKDPLRVLDQSPMTFVQVMAVAMCVALNALDGFDVLAISFAAPGIAAEWGIDRAALGVVLSMELVGMAIGAMVLGAVADALGRRPTILICLGAMFLGMLAAGFSQSLTALLAYRFVTGLGIGGMLASTNAMAAEYSNQRNRNMAVVLMAGGYPLGVLVGGSIATLLLERFDWRVIFFFGAAVTGALLIAVWYLLPESVSYLLKKRPPRAIERINVILARMRHEQIDGFQQPSTGVDGSSSTGTVSLFSPRLRLLTILLTAAYFGHIMTHYFFLKWVPKLVVDMGFAPSAAGSVLVWATAGGVVSSVIMGLLSHRYPMRGLTMAALVTCSASIVLFGAGASGLLELSIVATIAGFFTQAAVVGLYAIFAQSFPTEVRASGTGLVIGVGRGGAALGPIIAGLLFTLGLGLQSVALILAVGSIAGFVALFVLGLTGPGQTEDAGVHGRDPEPRAAS